RSWERRYRTRRGEYPPQGAADGRGKKRRSRHSLERGDSPLRLNTLRPSLSERREGGRRFADDSPVWQAIGEWASHSVPNSRVTSRWTRSPRTSSSAFGAASSKGCFPRPLAPGWTTT